MPENQKERKESHKNGAQNAERKVDYKRKAGPTVVAPSQTKKLADFGLYKPLLPKMDFGPAPSSRKSLTHIETNTFVNIQKDSLESKQKVINIENKDYVRKTVEPARSGSYSITNVSKDVKETKVVGRFSSGARGQGISSPNGKTNFSRYKPLVDCDFKKNAKEAEIVNTNSVRDVKKLKETKDLQQKPFFQKNEPLTIQTDITREFTTRTTNVVSTTPSYNAGGTRVITADETLSNYF